MKTISLRVDKKVGVAFVVLFSLFAIATIVSSGGGGAAVSGASYTVIGSNEIITEDLYVNGRYYRIVDFSAGYNDFIWEGLETINASDLADMVNDGTGGDVVLEIVKWDNVEGEWTSWNPLMPPGVFDFSIDNNDQVFLNLNDSTTVSIPVDSTPAPVHVYVDTGYSGIFQGGKGVGISGDLEVSQGIKLGDVYRSTWPSGENGGCCSLYDTLRTSADAGAFTGAIKLGGRLVVADTNWASATGAHSVALGYDPQATGAHSVALGRSKASGEYSLATGIYTEAGYAAVSAGYHTVASGAESIAAGMYTKATGDRSFIFGSGAGGYPISYLENDVDNSFMVGFNGNPTLFVDGSKVEIDGDLNLTDGTLSVHTDSGYAIYVYGGGGNHAVHAYSPSDVGVYGTSDDAEGVLGHSYDDTGVWGRSVNGHGVMGSSAFGYAGYFTGGKGVTIDGDLNVTGTSRFESSDGYFKVNPTTAETTGLGVTAIALRDEGVAMLGYSAFDPDGSGVMGLSLFGTGVSGLGDKAGVYGSSSDGYAIHGENTGDNYAGYFTGGKGVYIDGDLEVSKQLTCDQQIVTPQILTEFMNVDGAIVINRETGEGAGNSPLAVRDLGTGDGARDAIWAFSKEQAAIHGTINSDNSYYGVAGTTGTGPWPDYGTGGASGIYGGTTVDTHYAGYFSGGKGVYIDGDLDVNSLVLLDPSDDPGDCDSENEGAIYYDASLHEPCYCNAQDWMQFDGGGVC
jgi:hypothetical protein